MALQISGPISMQDIVDEFGGVAPHSLSEYYRGGAYVGDANTNVPVSGAIKLSDFYGAAAVIYDTKTLTCGTITLSGKISITRTGFDTFTNPAIGSITPPNFRGSQILACYTSYFTSTPANAEFTLTISGDHPRNFFEKITAKNGATVMFELLSSSETLSYYPATEARNYTRWFSPAVNGRPPFPASGTRTVIIEA